MQIKFISLSVNMSGGIRAISIYARALADERYDMFLVSLPEKMSHAE